MGALVGNPWDWLEKHKTLDMRGSTCQTSERDLYKLPRACPCPHMPSWWPSLVDPRKTPQPKHNHGCCLSWWCHWWCTSSKYLLTEALFSYEEFLPDDSVSGLHSGHRELCLRFVASLREFIGVSENGDRNCSTVNWWKKNDGNNNGDIKWQFDDGKKYVQLSTIKLWGTLTLGQARL